MSSTTKTDQCHPVYENANIAYIQDFFLEGVRVMALDAPEQIIVNPDDPIVIE